MQIQSQRLHANHGTSSRSSPLLLSADVNDQFRKSFLGNTFQDVQFPFEIEEMEDHRA